jgi:hypothetical protein
MGVFFKRRKESIHGYSLGKHIAENFHDSTFDDVGDVSGERISDEMLYLRIFGIDWFVFMHFNGDTPEKRAVLDGFYSGIQNKVDETKLSERLSAYAQAYHTPLPNKDLDEFWNVGKAFSDFCCGNAANPYLILLAVQFLNIEIKNLHDFFKKLHIYV